MPARAPSPLAVSCLPFLLLAAAASAELLPEPAPPLRPRLVVFVSVDQMRADYLDRFRPLFKSGLKAIAEQGAVFTNARYRHACTETGPGHSVLLSGRSPRSSGIVGNSWYDRTLRARVNVVGDPTVRVLGGAGRTASPAYFNGFTVGDMLKTRSPRVEGRGRVVQGPRGHPDGRKAGRRGVLVRERGRPLRDQQLVHGRGSRAGSRAGTRGRRPDGFEGRVWERLLPDPATYVRLAGEDEVKGEGDGKDTVFPHRLRGAPPATRVLRRPAPHSLRRRDPLRLRDRGDEGPRHGHGRGDGHPGRELLGLRRDRPHVRPRQPGADGQLPATRPHARAPAGRGGAAGGQGPRPRGPHRRSRRDAPRRGRSRRRASTRAAPAARS